MGQINPFTNKPFELKSREHAHKLVIIGTYDVIDGLGKRHRIYQGYQADILWNRAPFPLWFDGFIVKEGK